MMVSLVAESVNVAYVEPQKENPGRCTSVIIYLCLWSHVVYYVMDFGLAP